MGLALGDAFGLRLVHRVDAVAARGVPVLGEKALREGEVGLQPPPQRRLPGVGRHERHSRQFPDDAPQVALHGFDAAAQALVLPGLGVAGALAEHLLALPAEVARQPDAQAVRHRHEPFAGAVEHSRVGRMPDELLLHVRVGVDALEVGALGDLVAKGAGERFAEHLLAAPLGELAAPAAERGLVGRRPVLEERPAAEVLPVRVFDPAVEDLLVAQTVHATEHGQPGEHPHGAGWSSIGRRVRPFQGRFEALPIDGLGQQHEFVGRIEKVGEHDFPQPGLDGLSGGAFRHHFSGAPGRFP